MTALNSLMGTPSSPDKPIMTVPCRQMIGSSVIYIFCRGMVLNPCFQTLCRLRREHPCEGVNP